MGINTGSLTVGFFVTIPTGYFFLRGVCICLEAHDPRHTTAQLPIQLLVTSY